MMPYGTGDEPRAARTPYAKWLFEAIKVIGAAAIATLIALQVAITRQDEQIKGIRDDIERIRTDGSKLHDVAERERDRVSNELRSLRDLLHEHEIEAMRRFLLQEKK